MTDKQIKAYSYIRFSTPEQAQGDSLRRQMQLAIDYAEQNNLLLDDKLTFRDLGKSAYTGANVEAGRLGEFKIAVEAGIVAKESYLLVESLDRISRQVARKAVRVLEDICELGIVVVTLIDGKAWTADKLDGYDFIFSILLFMRANEESATKSKRLKQAWHGKRLNIADKPLTKIAPAWLELVNGEFRPIAERAKIVNRMFEEYAKGSLGKPGIAAKLNNDNVPVWGIGKKAGKYWHRSYIDKILNNDAVLGTLTPHLLERVGAKKTRTALEPIKNYYPAIISQDLWDAVQTKLSGNIRYKTTKELQNLLSAVAVCPLCGARMIRVMKSKRWVYLVCGAAKGGKSCEYRAIPYQRLEEVFLEAFDSISDRSELHANEVSGELLKQLRIERKKLQRLRLEESNILAAIEQGKELDGVVSSALNRHLIGKGQEIKTLEYEINKLAMQHKESGRKMVDYLLKQWAAESHKPNANKERLNQLLQQLFVKIELHKLEDRNVKIIGYFKSGPVFECSYNDSSMTRPGFI